MVDTSASIRLRAIDTNVVATMNDISTKTTNATLATTALAAAFRGLEKVSRTNYTQMVLGAKAANDLATGLSVAANTNSKLAKSLGAVGNYVFFGQQLAILGAGITKATDQFVRLPQALQAMQASGVTTRTIEEFIGLTQAIKGSDLALESLLVNSISELGRFEAAAARAGTILKSSFRLNEAGVPERANAEERFQNALEVQKLVNEELNNSVTSSQALLGQYEVLSAGFTSATESQKVLTSGLKLIGVAEAGGVTASPTETLQLVTKTLNAYELSANEAAKTSAILNAIVENGLTTIPQLSLGFGATAKQAKSANIALVDLGASVSVLTSQGVSTPEALTGISRLSANILNKTPEAEKALTKLQLRGEKIRFDKAEIQAKGFTQALVDLNEAAGGSAEVLAKIFPEDVAFRTATALLAEQGKRLADTRQSIGTATASDLQEVFDIAQSDRTKRFERLANRFREIIIKIGTTLADTIEPGLSALEEIADRFANLPEPVKTAIGQFLAFKIAANATRSALWELVKTLASLATNYLSVRLISLALTGQLGNEFKTIKALINQRKGLMSATLQLFGVNQRWRLSSEETTAAIKEQGKVIAAVANATAKVSQTAKNTAVAGAAKLSGVTVDVAKTEIKNFGQQALATAQSIAQQGRKLIVTGLEKVGIVPPATPVSAFVRTRHLGKPHPLDMSVERSVQPSKIPSIISPTPKVASYAPSILPPTPKVASYTPSLIPPTPKRTYQAPGETPGVLSSPYSIQKLEPVKPTPITPFQLVSVSGKEAKEAIDLSKKALDRQLETTKIGKTIQPFQFIPLTSGEIKPVLEQTKINLDRQIEALVSKDKKFLEAAQQKELALATSKQNLQARNAAKASIAKSKVAIQKAELAVTEAQNKAIEIGNNLNATAVERESAIAEVTKKQNKLKQAKLRLADAELNYTQLNTDKLILRNRAIEASNKLEKVRNDAATKYTPLAQALSQQEEARAKAIAFSQAATVAQYKAEQIATAQGYKSSSAIEARNAARIAENRAIKAGILLKQKETTVDKISTEITKQQRLAELGLFEAKVFGRDITLTSVGLLGKINKLMTADINLKLAAAAANTKLAFTEANLAKVRAFFTNSTDLTFLKIWAQQSNLLALNIKGVAKAIGSGLFGAAGKVNSAFEGMLGQFKVFAPLLQVGAIAAIVLRNELFGLGAQTRKLTKDYKEYLAEQRKLNQEIGRSSGLTALSRLAESDPAAFKDKLLELRESGIIADKEFNKLSRSISELGSSGDKNKKKLEELRRELDSLALTGKQKVEQGVVDSILGGIKAVPGLIGSVFDGAANFVGASVGSVGAIPFTGSIFTKGRLTGIDETALSRELDLLKRPLSELDVFIQKTGDRYLETNKAVNSYRESLALTRAVQAKVARGEKLTTEDLKQEEAKFKNTEKLNEQQIQAIKKRLEEDQKTLDKTKKAEARAIYQNRMDEARKAKETLEEENAKFKQLRTEINKYLIEELPKIRTALQENSNPTLALTNAQEKFEQAYIKDSEGRTTKLLKPLQVLRDEAFKLAAQTQENLTLGALDGAKAGELVAAESLRRIRDDQLEVMQDGELKRGYRLTIADRRSFSEQIIALENAELKRAETRTNIEIENIRAVGRARLEVESNTNLKIVKLQAQQLNSRIAQKEKEIDELSSLGLRTIDQEIQLQQLQAQASSQSLQLELARLNQQFQESAARLQRLQLRNEKIIAASQQSIQFLSQENTITQANTNYVQQQLSAIEKRANVQTSISQNEVYNSQVQIELLGARERALIATIPYQKTQLENEIKITKEQNKQRKIQAETQVANAKLALEKAEDQLAFARSNDASLDQLDQLRLAVEQQELQLQKAYEGLNQAVFQEDIEGEITRRKREQLDLEQQSQIQSLQIAKSQAERAKTEAKITRNIQRQSTYLANIKQKAEIDKNARSSLAQFRTGELNLALQLTNKEKDKLKIAKTIASTKLKSLQSQLRSEAQILAINQQQQRSQLQAQKSKNQAALSQNLADIVKAQAEVGKLQAGGASAKKVKAAQLFVDAQLAQRTSLQYQSQQLRNRENLQRLSQRQEREAFRRSSRLQIDRARVESLSSLPEKEQKALAKQLQREFLRRGGGTSGGNLKGLIKGLSNFKVKIPEIKIPEINFPSIDKIRKDVESILSEFKTSESSQEQTKSFTIQTLNMDSPINIEINGADDKEEIAQAVEGAVFNRMTDILRGVETELNQ